MFFTCVLSALWPHQSCVRVLEKGKEGRWNRTLVTRRTPAPTAKPPTRPLRTEGAGMFPVAARCVSSPRRTSSRLPPRPTPAHPPTPDPGVDSPKLPPSQVRLLVFVICIQCSNQQCKGLFKSTAITIAITRK